MEFKAAALQEKVTSLWTRLAVPVEERDEFNQNNRGSHIKTIKAVSCGYGIQRTVIQIFERLPILFEKAKKPV